jgi:hypothetical protein
MSPVRQSLQNKAIRTWAHVRILISHPLGTSPVQAGVMDLLPDTQVLLSRTRLSRIG